MQLLIVLQSYSQTDAIFPKGKATAILGSCGVQMFGRPNEQVTAPPDPTDCIENLKTQAPEPDPFTAQEVEAALGYIRKRDPVTADYFELAAFAGLRPSEQIALLWPDIDLRTGTALIKRARVLGKDKDRTKTHRARTVEFNDRAAAVLERQRARTQMKNAEVFYNPATNKPYIDEQCQTRIWTAALRVCGIRHRPPKDLRDTRVTMALQAGASLYWVASPHGHSVLVMLKNYAKWLPDADGGRNLDAVNRALAQRNRAIPQ